MLNITDVIRDIKMSLGLETIALPFDKPTEIVLKEIIQISVRTFSQFKPLIREGYENRKNLRSPDEQSKRMGIYILPASLTVTPVQYADAYMANGEDPKEQAAVNVFTVGTPFVGFGSYYPQDIINAVGTGAAINKYSGVTSKPQTSKWLGYNRIQLFEFPDNAYIKFVAKCDHDLSCETIPITCRESFMELASLDVKRTLYSMLKNMNTVGSAFKEIQLRIDDWSGAESERKQLVDSWTSSFHIDDLDLVQFF